MNYRESYEMGVQLLQGAGIEEARLDAALLLEYVCHTARQDLLAHGDREVALAEYESYVNLVAKRKSHIPLQHLTGVQEFMGLEFKVNGHVLIPRQDTEILAEEVLRYGCDNMRLLDLCTGSGCILLSLLHYSNQSSGVGVDLSGQALAVAEENAKLLGLKNAAFLQSDLFERLAEGQERFDLIVSNPPYIRTGVIGTLMEEVREHEPSMALDGGADGLFFYNRIIREAGRYLCRGGRLFLEIGYDQAEAVTGLLLEYGYREIEAVRDYAGLDRVVHAVFTGQMEESCLTD